MSSVQNCLDLFNEAIERLCVCPNWEKPHLIRYRRTFRYLVERGILLPDNRQIVLDVGGPSPFRAALVAVGFDVYDTGEHDLRYPLPASFTGGNVDLVLACEVFEHLADQEVSAADGGDWLDKRAQFRHTGQQCFLNEMRRLLKPDGRLVVTTPNAVGWCALYRLLQGKPPHMWGPHVREVCPDEFGHLADQAGLQVQHCEGWDVWPQLEGGNRGWRSKASHMVGFLPGVIREDCIVYLCKVK